MGGKKGGAQRVKNNAKPSSSGRTAEQLLSSGGLSLSPFSSSLKQTSFNTTANPVELFDPNLDPHFVVVFKKLAKKDATTRHKALLEFVSLCNAAEDDTVLSLVPSWVRLYGNLVVDVEHRVREAAQHAHRAVVVRVKRNLAPYIKQIVPFWFISQYDTHAPAASIAAQSFRESFPPHKIVDVIVFCQEEILKYITNNLLSSAIETSSQKTKNEELEARYERLTVMCLNGYSLYLSTIPLGKLEAVQDLNASIISSPKFWKLCKYKTGSVRAAWFSLISSILKNTPFLLEKEHKKLINSVLVHIDDYDPLVLPTVWEAILHCVTVVEDCWQHVSLEKLVLAKLCAILNHGGQGSAYVIFPNVLLLLSNIPDSLIKNKTLFYTKLFSSFQEGSKQQSVLQSHTESEALVTSFVECIRYLIMKNSDDQQFCNMLIDSHVMNFMSNTMTNSLHRHQIVPFYTSLVQTLLYWKKNEPKFNQYLEHFFGQLPNITKRDVERCLRDVKDLSFLLDCHLDLIKAFNFPDSKRKKNLKVHFTSTSLDEPEDNSLVCSPPNELNTEIATLIGSLVIIYFNGSLNHESKQIRILMIRQLWRLSQVLSAEQLSGFLKDHSQELNSATKRWLYDVDVPTKLIVGLIFNTIDSQGEEKLQESLLTELLKARSKDAIVECIKLEVGGDHCYVSLKKWLQSELVKGEICDLMRSAISSGDEEELSVIRKCLSPNRKGEYILGENTTSTLMDCIHSYLNLESTVVENASTVLMDSLFINSNASVKANDERIFNLLKSIFEMVVTGRSSDVINLWKKGVTNLSESFKLEDPPLHAHLIYCANFIGETLTDSDNYNDVNPETIVDVLTCLSKSTNVDSASKLFIETITQSILAERVEQMSPICCDTVAVFSVHPEPLLTDQNPSSQLSDLNLFTYTRSLLVLLKYTSEIIGFTASDTKMKMIEFLSEMLYGVTLSKIIINNFTCVKMYFEAQRNHLEVENVVKTTLKTLTDDCLLQLVETCYEKAKMDGPRKMSLQMLYDECLFESRDSVLESLKTNINELLHRTDLETTTAFIFPDAFETYKTSNFYAGNRDLKDMTDAELRYNVDLGRALIGLLKSPESWNTSKNGDGLMVITAEWALSLSLTQDLKPTREFARFVVCSCDLYKELIHFLSTQNEPAMSDPWHDVLEPEAQLALIKTWGFWAEKTSNTSHLELLILNKLSEMICYLCDTSEKALVTDLKPNLQMLTKTIISPYILVQITSYKLTKNIIPALVQMDYNCDENSSKDLSCHHFADILAETQTIVTTLLQDFTYGVSCTVTPYTDSYTYTLAYLMIWSTLLEMCNSVESQIRYLYTLWIKEQESIDHLMQSIFKLLPDSVINLDSAGAAKKSNLFRKPPKFSFENWTSESLSHFACWLYYCILKTLPAVARQWVAETDPKFLSFVDKLTTLYVSPVLCDDEMAAIEGHGKEFDNMHVLIHGGAREIVAVYTLEEVSTELVIKLAANHPLSPPRVEMSKSITLSSNQNRQWLMQLTILLTHQNGSIWDGLLLWKSNLDKKFEGIEECYICFSIVHNSSHQIPKMTCQTCKKKFHSFCLYKWFYTSHKSTCPICRNHF